MQWRVTKDLGDGHGQERHESVLREKSNEYRHGSLDKIEKDARLE